MSMKQMTQVQYQQQGLLYKEEKEEMWLNEFFNDDGQSGSYKKDIRSCSLVQQKGINFQFVHKSIQEFLIAADVYEVLVLSIDLDTHIMKYIIEMLSKENNYDQDCINFVKSTIQKQDEKLNQDWDTTIQQTIEIKHFVKYNNKSGSQNYSTQNYTESRQYLIKKLQQNIQIIEFLKLLVHSTKIDNKMKVNGSNVLNMLVEIKVDLIKQNFENIRIQNTSLFGGNFAKCNLIRSQFDNVNINGINLNGAILYDCQWKNLKINDLHQLNGHSFYVRSVCFSPDGTTLASRSKDRSIRLWDVKTGKKIQSTYKSYQDILAQFNTQLFSNYPLPESISANITIVLISQTLIFYVQGAIVLEGEFINYQGVDLRSLLKSKGSLILDKQVELQQK